MTQPTMSSSTATNSKVLADLLEKVTARVRAGEPADFDALLAEHPEHAEELRQLLPAVQFLADLSRSTDEGTFPPTQGEVGLPREPLGDYRLIREVGRGGMGVVYEAEQLSLGRRVALKVLPFAATMDPKQLLRFRNEAMAAASLRHEHIVHVYGVGCERGVHFYAMEFIDGITLADVIAARFPRHSPPSVAGESASGPLPPCGGGLGWGVLSPSPPHPNPPPQGGREQESGAATAPIAALTTDPGGIKGREFYRTAARLIADAADALEHAHQLGVVHRDVKPGNLMVDAAGKLWVADFGLARFGPDAGLTMSGDLLGTLRYMAPEQALAKHGLVDHRVDIYGLGSTLYELLAGKSAVGGEDKAEILRHIAFEEPVALRKVDKAIPAELETIALKCLAKEPGERYATAGEVADDLRRFLEDQPIRAKPPTFRQRTSKWTGRHRAGIAEAAAFLILATAGLAASVVLLAKKESETRQANANGQRRLEQLEKANLLLESIFDKLDPHAEVKGGPKLREQLKQQLQATVRVMDGEAIGDEVTVAALQNTLGNSLRQMGEATDAVVLLDKAIATRKRLLGPDHVDTLISQHNLAVAIIDQGHYAEAIPLLESVRDREAANLGTRHPDTLNTTQALAGAYCLVGRTGESIRLLEQVRDAYVDTLGAEHKKTTTTLSNLAQAYRVAYRLPEAIRLLEQLRDIEVAKFGIDHPTTLSTLHTLALAYSDSGRRGDAVRIYKQVHEAQIAKLGEDQPDTLITLHDLASCYMADGNLPEAIRVFERVRDAQVPKLGRDHPVTLATLNSIAIAYQRSDNHSKAIPLFEEVCALANVKLGPKHQSTLLTLSSLATSYRAVGRLPEAIRMHEQARDALLATLGPDHPHTLSALTGLAGDLESSGRLPDAIRLYEQLRDVRTAKSGADHPDTLGAMIMLAKAYQKSRRPTDAIRLFEKVRAIEVAKLGAEHPDVLSTSNNLASAYQDAGRLREAIDLFKQVRVGQLSTLGPDHPDTMTVLHNLAIALQDNHELPEACALFDDVATRLERKDFQHPLAGRFVDDAANCFEKVSDFEKATAWRRKWLATVKKSSGSKSPQYAQAVFDLSWALSLADQLDQAEIVAREWASTLEATKGAESEEYANSMLWLGAILFKEKKYIEAEPVIRRGLTICEKRSPGSRATFAIQFRLGNAILGQKRAADAEELLRAGYAGLKQQAAKIPADVRPNIIESFEQAIRLYDDMAEKDKAEEWRKNLAAFMAVKAEKKPGK